MRELTADRYGLGHWIERTAKEMDELQLWRELVQNGIEAGAKQIVIDGWTDPDTGQVLARCTDNGAGMGSAQLVKHLSTMHVETGKGEGNYGVGARLASLPRNPAGVSFASRTADEEGMIRIIKESGVYGIAEWPVDVDGFEEKHEVVDVDGELERLAPVTTGTAVILHGDGESNTWDESIAFAIHKFLSDRYYAFPEDVTIRVQQPSSGGVKLVKPFGSVLAEVAESDGEVPFKNVRGLNGVIFWWVLPESKSRQSITGTHKKKGGVGLTVADEIFNYEPSYLPDFGVLYASVQSRVALLIWIDEASMDTSRAGVVLPTRQKSIPWKKLGGHFAQYMPKEIEDLIASVSVSSVDFTEEMAKLLDKRWYDKLNPVPVPQRAKTGDPTFGEGEDDEGGEEVDVPPIPVKPKKKRKPRSIKKKPTGGDQPAQNRQMVIPPSVKFVSVEEMPPETPYIVWNQTANTILVSEEFPPYLREIHQHVQETGHNETIVREAVKNAYSVELPATIIDANKQKKAGLGDAEVEEMKSPMALYAKMLGFQSLSERVRQNIRDAAKLA